MEIWDMLGACSIAVLLLSSAAHADDPPAPSAPLFGSDLLPTEPAKPESNDDWLAQYVTEEEPTGQAAEPVTNAEAEPLDKVVYLDGNEPSGYTFGYNAVASGLTWLPGGDDQFGWFSYESFANMDMGSTTRLALTGFGVHFLNGPVRTDMPARMYDFTLGAQDRRRITPNLGYDIAFHVGVFSDFEGSAEKGIRFPSHAVTFWRLGPEWEMVLGIDYLDRDDITLLPVGGVIWRPADYLKLESVFPRPRFAVRVMNTEQWLYVAGELGGGTWAIERVPHSNDNVTYRDMRLILGWESVDTEHLTSALEFGYVFARDLSYRSGVGDYDPPDGWMLRLTARY
jgi:hypothetical protein